MSPLLKLNGQEVNGHWYGIGMIANTQDYNSYLSELVLRQKGSRVSGELNYYYKDSLVQAKLTGTYNRQTRKLSIRPFDMIYYRSPNAGNSIDCRLSGDFTLLISKASTSLNGRLFSDADHKYTVPDISYRFVKSDDTANLVMHEPEPKPVIAMVTASEKKDTITKPMVAPNVSADLAMENFTKRPKLFTKEIEVENNSLRLEIYDNGEIDYDSVTLYLNNKRILPKSMLTHRAIRLTIELDPALAYNELSMFAENLGRIPPNTAALVIYDGKLRYETLLSSDLNKSATIKLTRKK
jgi:hypothetical protein